MNEIALGTELTLASMIVANHLGGKFLLLRRLRRDGRPTGSVAPVAPAMFDPSASGARPVPG